MLWFLQFSRAEDVIISLALEKCEKERNVPQIFLVQGLCQLKIKITQFPHGFRLKLILGSPVGFPDVGFALFGSRDSGFY